jgi:hypothetical protein
MFLYLNAWGNWDGSSAVADISMLLTRRFTKLPIVSVTNSTLWNTSPFFYSGEFSAGQLSKGII